MLIRKAREEDLESLLSIYNYEVEHTTATFDVTPKTLEQRREWLCAHNTGNHPLLVAVAEDCIAGYAALSPYRMLDAYRETVELSVYVERRFRGKGIARRLMEEILWLARNSGEVHCIISVITGGNEASIHLHEAFGFTCCGTMREVGQKFGTLLDIVNYQLIV